MENFTSINTVRSILTKTCKSENAMSIKTNYRQLESKTQLLRKEKRFKEAREKIGEMIALIESNYEKFDEPKDRISILRSRISMLFYAENRVSGRNLPKYLREAATYSTPSTCTDNVCDRYKPHECKVTKKNLSYRQQKMCNGKLTYLSDALKIEAALSARTFNYTEALEKSRLSVKVHSALCASEPTKANLGHQNYLAYWQQVSEHSVALMDGDFELSRTWLKIALDTARNLDISKCFPNYFQNIVEMRAHFLYIDAVEKIKKGLFKEAKEDFIAWLDFDIGRTQNLRRDNIIIFEKICDFLQRISKETIPYNEWESLENQFESRYVAKTTWALWNKLQWIRELSFRISRNTRGKPFRINIEDEIAEFSSEWPLFIYDTILLGEERTSGLRRAVNIPSIVDVFPFLDERRHFWKEILYQNIKNLLLLMIEYEELRHAELQANGASISIENNSVFVTEQKTITELFETISEHLRCRPLKYAILEKSHPLLIQFIKELNNNNYIKAIVAQENFLRLVRFWPHLIYINSVEDTKQLVFLDENTSEINSFRIKAKRLWNTDPKEIIFEGPQQPELQEYYFLRPRWNVRKGEHYKIRHEHFYKAEFPRWINIFFKKIFKTTETDSTNFQKWIFQFSEFERLLICRLLDALEFYNEEKIRKTWARVFRKLPPEVRRTAIFVGFGHGAKSGRLNPYLFRQGVSELPEYGTVFEGREKFIFRDLSEFDVDTLGLQKPSAVVFLDDFIGTGGQSFDFLKWYFDKYEWLNQTKVYLAVLVGFEKAINDVKQRQDNMIEDIIAGDVLHKNMRAFSPQNPIWKDEIECKKAESLVNEIGKKVLQIHVANDHSKQQIYDVDRDSLGWHNCQALIAFHHNIPSNTLPIFWGEGEMNESSWVPLFHRYD